jgi:methylenetetrahydrofolate reductase (NADPH)
LRSLEMTKKVAGMVVPDTYLDRMKKAANQEEEGVNIALDLIEALKKIEGVSGIHIMAVGWESIVPTVVERAGFLPRPKLACSED